MSINKLLSWALFAGVFIACATLVLGHPQLFNDDQEPIVDDEPLTRNRRDSLPAGGHHHQQHQGWGWEKPKGWGWEKPKGWGGWPSVGPVFTYVRTDGWSNFQWGVRHKVGKGYGK